MVRQLRAATPSVALPSRVHHGGRRHEPDIENVTSNGAFGPTRLTIATERAKPVRGRQLPWAQVVVYGCIRFELGTEMAPLPVIGMRVTPNPVVAISIAHRRAPHTPHGRARARPLTLHMRHMHMRSLPGYDTCEYGTCCLCTQQLAVPRLRIRARALHRPPQYARVVKRATARLIQCALKVSTYLEKVPVHGSLLGTSTISTKLVECPVVESVPARVVVL
jgi:hypothetical protein